MAATLPKSAQRVQNFLLAHHLADTIVELTGDAHTAQAAANLLGCSVAQIVKSLIFCAKDTKEPILLLVSGSNRVNEKLITQHLGHTIERATPELVRTATGFAIGGVAPVGHQIPMKTFIDQDLCNFEIVWAAAGTPNTVFSLTPAQLEKVTGGTVIAVHD
jgi:prolyl-tRNA editing enzyme YbaK/EbsC (Cys-tRNA(Pro) deacylase)